MKFTLAIHAAVGVWFARSVRILSIDGTVTINNVGENSSSGSFDIVTDEGDNMVGSFSFDVD